MSDPLSYQPPTSEQIRGRQNDDESLRLLLAQRRLYSKAKFWLGTRWLGMIVIGIGAPVVSVIWPALAVVAGAAAGLWIFLGRTMLAARQRDLADRAAAVQERFDLHVFGMPNVAPRPSAPSPEEITLAAGGTSGLHDRATKQRLFDWYPIRSENVGAVSVAISQRANAAYTDRLLRKTGAVWAACALIWAVVLVVACVWVNLSFRDFLLGILLPVLPAALDVIEFMRIVRTSAHDREGLASAIQQRLIADSAAPEPGELQVWQDRLYELRRSTPLVPDHIYWLSRKRNEDAMHSAASELSAASRNTPGGGEAG